MMSRRRAGNLIELLAESFDIESMSGDKPKRFPIPKPGVLLVVGLVIAVLAVGLSVWIPYYREQMAIRDIERLGGEVYYYIGGPQWLRDLVGDGCMVPYDRVDGVAFGSTRIGVEDLQHLPGLANLNCLSFDGTQISDADLVLADLAFSGLRH